MPMRLMDSAPPPIVMSCWPDITWAAAKFTASSPDERDPFRLPEPLGDFRDALRRSWKRVTIGVSPTLGHAQVDAEVARAFERTLPAFEDIGAHVELGMLQRSSTKPEALGLVVTIAQLHHVGIAAQHIGSRRTSKGALILADVALREQRDGQGRSCAEAAPFAFDQHPAKPGVHR